MTIKGMPGSRQDRLLVLGVGEHQAGKLLLKILPHCHKKVTQKM